MLSVLASTNQCHPKFYGQGRQCVANSHATFIYHYNTKKVSQWLQADLDKILHDGDDIYHNIMSEGQEQGFLLITDLPTKWKSTTMNILKTDAGSLYNRNPCRPYASLPKTLTEIITFAFLTIK